MASLDRNLRRDLENAVKKARRVAATGARAALVALRVGEGRVPTGSEAALRKRLRAHGRQLGDKLDERKETQSIERLKDECAYQHWHRLLFARFLAENELLVEPESGMALSLDECRELAREQNKDWLVLASEFAQRMLPQIFRAGDPVLEIALPPEKRQELEAILQGLPHGVFIADDSLGWVYQFWQSDQKDAVNASQSKIGANELPAVTQLFTEDYMVLFLLHNTLGAWWAGKVLAANSDLAGSASTEDELRAACAVQGVEWSYLRFVREDDVWRPAAGTFSEWPTAAKDLTVLDPCMGSGHFLAFALPMLVALRREEEKLSVAEAVDAVLRANLFGLELDPRCTQIAAFNVGLTAWKLAGYRPLPALNLACSGLGINAPVAAWTALAAGDALAENAMKQLYELFRQAPTLGSLIDPTRVGGELFVANFDQVRSLLSSALASEQSEDTELAVVAQGIAKAAFILADRYTLVATNVPYLGRGRQDDVLKMRIEGQDALGKADLATAFVLRCLVFCAEGGSTALVTPQNWLFLTTYTKLRQFLLERRKWDFVARLGPGAFETIGGHVVNVALLQVTATTPDNDHAMAGIDVSDAKVPGDKAMRLRGDHSAGIVVLKQAEQLKNPDARVTSESPSSLLLLEKFAICRLGLGTGDAPHYLRRFWEVLASSRHWSFFQNTTGNDHGIGGYDGVVAWDSGRQRVLGMSEAERVQAHNQDYRGREVWNRRGISVSIMSTLRTAPYEGALFDKLVAAIVPNEEEHLGAIRTYVESEEFTDAVRRIDQKLMVTNATLVKVPFDLAYWQKVAEEKYPHGLPEPEADDPTQWPFHGRPEQSAAPLQVAVARLVGYHWPAELDPSMRLSQRARDLVKACDELLEFVDEDGIVCLPALRGEPTAADRVLALIAKAFRAEWSAQKLNEVLAAADFAGQSTDDWLRDGFFDQHCALFHQRPFVWQVWDGRKDGFSALVNYHRLAAPNGEGRRNLDKLTHTYLGDWLDRQRADQKAGVEGADGRVAAAEHLKRELERILEGEPPYDIFVRWKPLHQQPVGWEPDIDDGVRVNIRPFMTAKPFNARGKNACILRVAPKIKWDKDRGKEPTRNKADYPWFWGWDEETQNFMGGSAFDGNRWNDLHYSRAVKLAARERAKAGTP